MSRTIPREVEGADWRVWPEEIRRLGWAKLFGRDPDAPLLLNVDIGFGDGEFLLATARRDPEGVYVGIELSFKRVLKVARRLANSEIRNIRLVGIDAEWVIAEALADESVGRAWINFPDPWPRRRHHGRRIVEPRLIRSLSNRVISGAQYRTIRPVVAEPRKVIQHDEKSLVARSRSPDRACRRGGGSRLVTVAAGPWCRRGPRIRSGGPGSGGWPARSGADPSHRVQR